jgi:hypothetical protein
MEPAQSNSIWNAALKAGVVFGFAVFLISTIGSYITINSEPTGNLFSGTILASMVGCLVGIFGGFLGVKFHINEYGPVMKIGQGAVIGLMTGIVMAVVSQILALIWPLVDGAFIENLQTALIANIEISEQIPSAQKEDMIDAVYAQFQNFYGIGTILQGFFMGVVTYGLLNVLSGLLAAKFMGRAPEPEL